MAPARAEEASQVNPKAIISNVDISGFINNMRASIAINQEGELFYGAHIPIATLIGKKSGAEFINLNAGFVYSADDKASDFLFSLGFRIDSFINKFGTNNPNIVTATLPAIELGPFVSYGFNNWMYGGMVSIRLGGN